MVYGESKAIGRQSLYGISIKQSVVRVCMVLMSYSMCFDCIASTLFVVLSSSIVLGGYARAYGPDHVLNWKANLN